MAPAGPHEASRRSAPNASDSERRKPHPRLFAVASRRPCAYHSLINNEDSTEKYVPKESIVDQPPKTKFQLEIIAGQAGFSPAGTGKPLKGGPLKAAAGATSHPLTDTNGQADLPLASDSLELDFSKLSAALMPVPIPAAVEMAEGYLELVTQPAVRLGVKRRFRRSYARKALQLAVGCGKCVDDPKHEARRQMVIGQAQRLLRRYKAATAAFRRASTCRCLRVDALLAMGWCQKRSGQLEGAVVSLNRALAIAPEDARLHYNLACYLATLDQHRAAIYELAWAIELEPRLQSRALAESDFDRLRVYPAFVALTAARAFAQ